MRHLYMGLDAPCLATRCGVIYLRKEIGLDILIVCRFSIAGRGFHGFDRGLVSRYDFGSFATPSREWRKSPTQCNPIWVHLSRVTDTYDHRTLKSRRPVRSAIFKQRTGGLVVRWETTSEYLLSYVFFWKKDEP